MEFRQLTYFLTAAQTQNFRKAADICIVAQPALSRQIAALEEELGIELFKREKQRVILTAAGEAFARYVKAALDQLQQGQQAMAAIQAGQQGEVQIGCVEPLAAAFLPAVFTHFHHHYPQIHLSVRVMRTDDVLRLVEQSEIDLGLIFDPTSQVETVVVKELFRQSLHILAPPYHPFVQLDPDQLTLERVSAEPLILLSRTSRLRRNIERICTQRALPLHPLIEIDSIEGLKELVRQGTGITLLPPALLHPEAASHGLRLLPIADVSDTFIFALVYRRFGHIALPARQLINLISTSSPSPRN